MPEPQLIDPPYPFDGGKYVLNALVGEGSGGTRVYRALSTAGDIVAIKVIPRAFGGEARRRQKNYFEREVVAGRRLQYPQVRKLIATGEVERTKLPGALDDLLYLVFEFVDGVSVRDRLEASGFEPPEVRDLTFRVSLGLGMAHATGLIHRDVKPENILLPDGDVLRAKVADFGISRASEVTAVTTGIGIGTATYMAPEQFRDSSNVTQAADIYSLGLVIWECLTGAVPYGCEDPMATMEARLRAAPLGDLQRHGMKCPELSVVLRKALAKSPEGRYESILQMADAVVHAGAGDGIWEPQIREAVARGSDEAASFDTEEIDDQMSEPGEYEEDAELDEYEVTEEHWADSSFESSAGASRRGRSRKPNAAFMKAMTPSSTLAAVVGSRPLSRTQVTKKLWAYIKRNGLQDKKDHRMINADAKLRPIFQRDQLSMYEMTKRVSEHLS